MLHDTLGSSSEQPPGTGLHTRLLAHASYRPPTVWPMRPTGHRLSGPCVLLATDCRTHASYWPPTVGPDVPWQLASRSSASAHCSSAGMPSSRVRSAARCSPFGPHRHCGGASAHASAPHTSRWSRCPRRHSLTPARSRSRSCRSSMLARSPRRQGHLAPLRGRAATSRARRGWPPIAPPKGVVTTTAPSARPRATAVPSRRRRRARHALRTRQRCRARHQ